MASVRPTILFVVNVEWYFLSHRLPLARALRAQGWDVVVMCGEERGEHGRIEAEGFTFVPWSLDRKSFNPWREAKAIAELARAYQRVRPLLLHQLTIKPALYGSFIARLTGQRFVVNTLAGLGYMFTGRGPVAAIRRTLTMLAYRLAWSSPRVHAIFQNREDCARFVRAGILDATRATVVAGSGVDPARFKPSPEPAGAPVVLMAARLLWDKGVGEFVEAAERVSALGIEARFVIAGAPDEGNPAAVPEEQLERWSRSGVVEWLGPRTDMPTVLAGCHLVVLPSYYPEGVPRILIEAAAAGRAIVTTDTPGCRDIVRHGENGLLVPARDASALAEAIAALVADKSRRQAMGDAGRRRVLADFTEDLVVSRTFDVYRALLGQEWPAGAVIAGQA